MKKIFRYGVSFRMKCRMCVHVGVDQRRARWIKLCVWGKGIHSFILYNKAGSLWNICQEMSWIMSHLSDCRGWIGWERPGHRKASWETVHRIYLVEGWGFERRQETQEWQVERGSRKNGEEKVWKLRQEKSLTGFPHFWLEGVKVPFISIRNKGGWGCAGSVLYVLT